MNSTELLLHVASGQVGTIQMIDDKHGLFQSNTGARFTVDESELLTLAQLEDLIKRSYCDE